MKKDSPSEAEQQPLLRREGDGPWRRGFPGEIKHEVRRLGPQNVEVLVVIASPEEGASR